MAIFGDDGPTPAQKAAQEAAEARQMQARQDATLLLQLLGRQFGGGAFGTNPELDRLVGNYGGNTLLDNIMRKGDFTVVNGYRSAATYADQATLTNTVSDMLIAARRLMGGTVTAAEKAQFREQAGMLSASLPTVISMMRSVGLDTALIENAVSSAYGKKGSTQQLYGQAVPALSRYMSLGSAARLSGHLTAGQYGAAWDANRVRGVSAQDLGSAINFMSRNGGYNKQSFWNGGFGLSNMGVMAQRFVRSGFRGPELLTELAGTYDQKAIDMAGGIYATELRMHGRENELYASLPKDYEKAYRAESAVGNAYSEYNTKYGLNLSFDRNDSLETAQEKIRLQFDQAMERAGKAKNEALKKELATEQGKAMALLKAYYSPADNLKDSHGKPFTLQQLATTRAKKMQQVASNLVQSTVTYMQQQIAALEIDRQNALAIKDADEREAALKEVRQQEAAFERYKSSSDLTVAASRVLDSPDALNKALDISRVGMVIKSAYANEGKQVTLDEALAASKALTGGSLGGIDTARFSKDVARTISAVMRSGGSMDAFFRNSQAFTEQAKAMGLDRDAISRINLQGERAGVEYGSAGMSDAEAEEQTMKDKNNMAVVYNASLMRGLRGIEHIMGTSKEMTDLMYADATDEEKALLDKIRDKRDLTMSDYKSANVLMNRALRRAYSGSGHFDADAMNDMLDSTQASDYSLRQMELLTNADYFWRGSTRFNSAMSQIQGIMDRDKPGTVITDEMKDAAWTLLGQNATMIREIVGKSSDGTEAGMAKLHEEQITAGTKLAESLSKNASTEEIGKHLYTMVQAARESGNTDELMRFMRSVAVAHRQTGLDPAAVAAKTTRDAVGGINDLKNTALENLTRLFPTVGSATLNDIMAAAAKESPEERRQALYAAFQLTDPNQIIESLADDAEGVAAIADALVLNGNVMPGPGKLHNGDEIALTADEIKAAQEFLAHPEYMTLTDAEMQGKVWHSTVNGEKVTFDRVAKMAQAAREIALSNIGLGDLMIADEYNLDREIRNSSPRVLYDRAVAARERVLKEKQAEVEAHKAAYTPIYSNAELARAFGSVPVKTSTTPGFSSGLGTFTGEVSTWLAANATDPAAKEMASTYSAAYGATADKERENQNAAYENAKKRIDGQLKIAMERAKSVTDPEEANRLRTAAELEHTRALKALEDQHEEYTLGGKKIKVRKGSSVSMSEIVGTEAGKAMYSLLKTAESELLQENPAVMSNENKARLAAVQTYLASYERAAQTKAENEVETPVIGTDFLFNDNALAPGSYASVDPKYSTLASARTDIASIDEALKKYNRRGLSAEETAQKNALLARKQKLQDAIKEDATHNTERVQQLGWLGRVEAELDYDVTRMSDDKLKEKYATILDKYGIDATRDDAIDLLRKRINFDQENFTERVDDKGNITGVDYDTSLGGIFVGTKEGAEMYKKLRDREKAGESLSVKEKNDMRRYERRLADWIKLHPEEAAAAGIEMQELTPGPATPPPSYVPSEDNSRPELTPDSNLVSANLEPGAEVGSPDVDTLAGDGQIEINDSNIVARIDDTNAILEGIYEMFV